MTVSQLFSLVNALAALQWLVLIFLPKAKFTQWLLKYAPVPILLSVIYCIYIAGFFQVHGGGFSSIQQVRTLFNNDNMLLAGWVHYLAFDLLIGFYILRTTQERHINHLLVIPSLVLTFMFGPAGYLSFQIIKSFKKNHENPIA
jgi:hypothetical protein